MILKSTFFDHPIIKSLSSSETLILLSLAVRANISDVCWPSQKKIMEDTKLCKNTVVLSLSNLKNKGLIEIKKHDHFYQHHPTKYKILIKKFGIIYSKKQGQNRVI